MIEVKATSQSLLVISKLPVPVGYAKQCLNHNRKIVGIEVVLGGPQQRHTTIQIDALVFVCFVPAKETTPQ